MSLAAPRKSGKSFFISKMLDAGLIKRFDHIVICCPSLIYNDDYLAYTKLDNVKGLPEFTTAQISELFNRQAKAMRKVRAVERGEAYSSEKLYCPDTLLILDDCIDSGVASFRGTVDKIAERGRHINLSAIISSQRLSAISRSIRLNSDFFITFSPYSVSDLEQFLEQFVSRSCRNELRVKIGDIYEKPYQFICLNNGEKSIRKKLLQSNAEDFIRNKMEVIPVSEGCLLPEYRRNTLPHVDDK